MAGFLDGAIKAVKDKFSPDRMRTRPLKKKKKAKKKK